MARRAAILGLGNPGLNSDLLCTSLKGHRGAARPQSARALDQDLADCPSAFLIRSSVVATSRMDGRAARAREKGMKHLGDFIVTRSDSFPFVRLILTLGHRHRA